MCIMPQYIYNRKTFFFFNVQLKNSTQRKVNFNDKVKKIKWETW